MNIITTWPVAPFTSGSCFDCIFRVYFKLLSSLSDNLVNYKHLRKQRVKNVKPDINSGRLDCPVLLNYNHIFCLTKLIIKAQVIAFIRHGKLHVQWRNTSLYSVCL